MPPLVVSALSPLSQGYAREKRRREEERRKLLTLLEINSCAVIECGEKDDKSFQLEAAALS
jgi:hypothetical protein